MITVALSGQRELSQTSVPAQGKLDVKCKMERNHLINIAGAREGDRDGTNLLQVLCMCVLISICGWDADVVTVDTTTSKRNGFYDVYRQNKLQINTKSTI